MSKPLTWDDFLDGLRKMHYEGKRPLSLRVERDKDGRWTEVHITEVDPDDPRVSQRLKAVVDVEGTNLG